MTNADDTESPNPEQLTEMIRDIRDRIRARHPSGETGESGDEIRVTAPDLMPLVVARDAAEAKVAAIGTVNPRPPGGFNSIIQSVKRFVARALDWHVREQVEFNRGVVDCVNTTIESLSEMNRALVRLTSEVNGTLARLKAEQAPLRQECQDLQAHWAEWRQGWEERLTKSEIQLLRSVADLQGAFQHRTNEMQSLFLNRANEIQGGFERRVNRMDDDYRELARIQHSEFTAAMERSSIETQKKLVGDLETIREEYERLIHNELRVLRQRAAARQPETVPAVQAIEQAPPPLDYLRFADRFRGTEDYVRKLQGFYVEKFRGCEQVLDLGCGRGEFLQVMKEAGISARGVDSSEEFVRMCRNKGLATDRQDMFEYLEATDDGSLDGIFCSQVVEHLPPAALPRLVGLAAAKLRRGGRIAIETPNPECLAIFATHFYLDPTHTRPVPASLLVFYLEEAGFGRIEVHPLSPAEESIPSVAELPEGFRKMFFGGLDYAVLGRRL